MHDANLSVNNIQQTEATKLVARHMHDLEQINECLLCMHAYLMFRKL